MGLSKCLRICCASISQRIVIAIAVLCGLALQLIHRLAFHLVLTEITNTFSVDHSDLTRCNFILGNKSSIVFVGRRRQAEFFWSYKEQTILISAYYIGNFVTLLNGGYLIDKIGLKRIFGFGVFINALGSLLTPLSANFGLYALVVVRTVMGLGHGPLILSETFFRNRWFLYQERYMFSTIMNSGIIIGGIIGFTGTGIMLQYFENWEIIFYCYGVVSFLWYVLWIVFVYDSVDKHPFISQREKRTLTHGRMIGTTYNEYEITLGTIFKSVPFWAVSIIHFGNRWTYYFISNLLPQYMARVLLFQAHETGLFCSLPFATMCIFSLCFGKLSNSLVSKGHVSKKMLTKLFTLLCAIFSPLCMLSASYAGCSKTLAVAFFSLSMGFLGLEYSAAQVFYKNISVRNSAMIQAVTSSISVLGGILVPLVFAMFNHKSTQSLEGWRNGFIFSTILVAATAVLYLIWGSGEIQDWHYASTIPEVLPEQSSSATRKQDGKKAQNIDPSLQISPDKDALSSVSVSNSNPPLL